MLLTTAKESVSLKVCQWKLPKLKWKQKTEYEKKKTPQNFQELYKNYKRHKIQVIGIPEGKERKQQKIHK